MEFPLIIMSHIEKLLLLIIASNIEELFPLNNPTQNIDPLTQAENAKKIFNLIKCKYNSWRKKLTLIKILQRKETILFNNAATQVVKVTGVTILIKGQLQMIKHWAKKWAYRLMLLILYPIYVSRFYYLLL